MCIAVEGLGPDDRRDPFKYVRVAENATEYGAVFGLDVVVEADRASCRPVLRVREDRVATPLDMHGEIGYDLIGWYHRRVPAMGCGLDRRRESRPDGGAVFTCLP